MPLVPDPPFPKTQGDNIRSKDWNDAVNEIIRLDNAKANRTGAETFSGPLTINGSVGIGTAAPAGALDVVGTDWSSHLRLTNTTNAGAGPSIFFKSSVRDWAILATHGGAGAGPGKLGFFDASASSYRLVIDAAGNLGVNNVNPTESIHSTGRVRAGNATIGPWPANGVYQMFGASTLDQANGGNYALLQSGGGGDFGTTFLNSPRSIRLRIGNGDRAAVDADGVFRSFVPFFVQQAHTIKIGMPAGPYGNDGIRGEPNLFLDSSGTVFIKQGFQSRGMDVAERFPVAEADAVREGEVVVYDESAGVVRPCSRAYDATAVGIVSEAPAFILGLDAGEAPVALCGRVPCWVDADVAPIAAGDLLVTSATPGHAQKCVDADRAAGRVIGKALESLAAGRGRILAFVLAA